MKRGGVFVLVFIVLLAFLVAGSVDLEIGNMDEGYEIGDVLRGSATLSLDDEPSDSEVRSVFSGEEAGNIGLLELLNKHNGLDYECSPEDCKDNFQIQGIGETSKSFSLGEEVLGVKLNGEVEINDFTVDISSNVGNSCNNQLSIDILDDGIIDWKNNNYLASNCGSVKTSDCYTRDEDYDEWFGIEQVPFCEKIEIPQGPAFDIIAFMKVDSSVSYSNDLLEGSLYDEEGNNIGNCNFDKPEQGGSEETCTIDYISKETQDVFVCVGLKPTSSIAGYEMQARSTGTECGFQGDPGQTSTFAAEYNIKIVSKKYAPINSFTLDETTYSNQNGDSLISYLNDYLDERYNSDCPSSGCIIPISFSGQNQNIDMDNLLVSYRRIGAGSASTDDLYDVSKAPATITSENLTLDLSLAEFSVPSEVKLFTTEIFIGNELIIEGEIGVNEKEPPFIEQVYPKIIGAGSATKFTAFIDPGVNLSRLSFEWDFGDNSSVKTSSTNKITHTYNEVGNFELSVTSKRGTIELGTSKFDVLVTSPIDAINTTLDEYNTRLNDVEAQIAALPTDYQVVVTESGLDVLTLKSQVSEIEDDYKFLLVDGGTDDEYVDIMLQLNALDIPVSVSPSKTSDLPLAFDVNDVILDDIVDLFNEYYISGKESEYENAIVFWYLDNIDANLKQKSYTINYESYKEDLITEFELQIDPRGSQTGDAYLIIEQDKDEIIFSETHNLFDESGITGIKFDLSKTNNIDFAIKGNIDTFGVTMYVAPELDTLGIRKSIIPEPGPGFWPKFLVGTIIVAIVTLAVYLLLQTWYKRNYENYLFKNQNNLYNLLYFIKNAKAKGLKESEIITKLKKAKWRKEQIVYAMKKFKGQRVGMWEIPLFKGFERKKMEKELERRKRVSRL